MSTKCSAENFVNSCIGLAMRLASKVNDQLKQGTSEKEETYSGKWMHVFDGNQYFYQQTPRPLRLRA